MLEFQLQHQPLQEDPLEKEMATHSGTLAWKIPWMEEPGRLQSMGLQPKNTETEWKEGKSDSSESRRTRVIKPGAWTRFLDGPGFPWGCGGLGSRNLKQSLDARVQGAPLLLLENKSKTEAHREDHAGHFKVLCPLCQQNLHWSRHQQALFF